MILLKYESLYFPINTFTACIYSTGVQGASAVTSMYFPLTSVML